MAQVENVSKMAKPFVKWAGGKQSLASTLAQYFPTSFEVYFEPFIGGGSVYFTVCPETAVIGDENEWLIDTYKSIRDNPREVAEKLDTLKNTKEDFLETRAKCPSELDQLARAAHFVYLNKTCFRGLFRVNRKGQFNVPYGAYDRRYYDLNNLLLASEWLQHADIRKGDFESTVSGAEEGDFVYFDPPYYKLGGYSDFNRYTPGQFREMDHVRLASFCRELDTKGVKWAVSNSNTPLVKKLFDGFKLIEVDARREINLNSKNRDVKELLIVNY